ncbi:MAG: hypothetical protein Kow0099_04600 [Candidatus Abyssubacteria bacterium]
MDWTEACGGLARRIALEDGTPVIAVLRDADGQPQLSFWSDVEEFDRVELESRRLGGLNDLIDVLQPEDLIEVCCRSIGSKLRKEGRNES